MKKLKFKNCIAFTLTEMTLVLLITGVIAVATTPIITSALSDASVKGTPTSAEVADTPWRITTKYNGGGIYNVPVRTDSVTSIGIKPGTRPINYNYAALIVQSNSSNNLPNAPQIQIVSEDSYTAGSVEGVSSSIAADEYQNFAFVYGNSFQNQKIGYDGVNNTSLGYYNVFMGNNIQSTSPADKAYYERSVFIGQDINTANAMNSVFIGSEIDKIYDEVNSINIGFGMGSYSNADSGTINKNNINIGNMAGRKSFGSYNVALGTSAGDSSKSFYNVAIGSYAAMFLGYSTRTYASGSRLYASQSNVAVGTYAGYLADASVFVSGNTFIGKYAGAGHENQEQHTQHIFNNTAIGSYAGMIQSSFTNEKNNLYIGDYAGYIGYGASSATAIENSVGIGYYASSANDAGNRSGEVSIGLKAGSTVGANNLTGNINIGYNAGFATTEKSYSINIGDAAGFNSSGKYSIYIGSSAGSSSQSSSANVGIGKGTCQGVTGGGKWCLGWGTYANTLTYSDNGVNKEVWNKSSNNNQMIIGNPILSNNVQYKSSIVFYANEVYRIGNNMYANQLNLSDKRLKTNIVPSKHSIGDIRKINIYDYNMKNDPRKTPYIGILAQEYRKIFPQDVVKDPSNKKLRTSVDWMLFTMINAVKDVDKYIQNLQVEFKAYAEDFAGLKSKVAKLEKQAKQIESENAQMREHLAKINEKLK